MTEIEYWRNRLENAIKDMIRISSIRDGYAGHCILNARTALNNSESSIEEIRGLTITLDSYVLYLVQHGD